MPTTVRPHQPDRTMMMPPDPRDRLPEGDLAHQISDPVYSLDLGAFHAPYEGDGRRNRPYDLRMIVKVLLYGYAIVAQAPRPTRAGIGIDRVGVLPHLQASHKDRANQIRVGCIAVNLPASCLLACHAFPRRSCANTLRLRVCAQYLSGFEGRVR